MNKIKTIADLKCDINLTGCTSSEGFKKDLIGGWGNDFSPNRELINNFNRKVKNGNYKFSVLLTDNRSSHYCSDLFQITETFEIKSKNLKLDTFIHTLYLILSEKIDMYNDWHCFLIGFKRINDFDYEVILGG